MNKKKQDLFSLKVPQPADQISSPSILRLKQKLYVPPEIVESLRTKKPISKNDLILRREKAILRIPKGIVTALYENSKGMPLRKIKELERSLSLVIDLRSLFREPLLMNYQTRYLQLAEYFNVHEKTVKTWIKSAIKLKLAFKEGENLRFISTKNLAEYFKVENKTKQKWKIHKHLIPNVGNVQEIISTVAVSENFNKQQFRLTEKIIVQLGIENDFIRPNYSCTPQEIKWLRKKLKFDKLEKSYLKTFKERYNFSLLTNEHKKNVNPNITLSCQGTAKILNRKSRASGYRTQQRLKKSRMLSVKRDYLKTDSKAISQQHSLSWLQKNFFDDVPERTDIFAYSYHLTGKEIRKRIRENNIKAVPLSGQEKMCFVNLPNRLKPLII